MQSTITIIEPATSYDLITLDDLKIALNISGTDKDPMLTGIIERISMEVAALCNNRVFGREHVVETFTEVSCDSHRLFLARYPLKWPDINTINGTPVVPNGDMLLDGLWGKLTTTTGVFGEGITLDYSGGYNLPAEAPPALQQAVVALAREAYYASLRGDQTVRSLSHKESRIIFFDPNILARSVGGGGAGAGGTPAMRAARDVLSHFTRYEI
jgi:hypothetical protein